jgi:hypothetical protein
MAFIKIEQASIKHQNRLFIDNAKKICAAFGSSELENIETEVQQLNKSVGADLIIGRGNGHIWIHEQGNPQRLAIITLKRLHAYETEN